MFRTWVHRHAILFGLIGIWIIVTAFNINKAITVDDNYYLMTARAFVQSPDKYLRITVPHSGQMAPLFMFNQPHFLFWIYSGVIKIFGFALVPLHLTIAAFALAAIFGMYTLAKYFVVRPFFITAVFALGPAFLPGQNLMTDVPLIALWLWFFVLLLKGGPASKKTDLAIGLLLAAAILIKYTTLILFPIFVGYVVFKKQYRRLWILLLPLAAVIGWSALTFAQYGAIHILSRPQYDRSFFAIAIKTIHWPIALGASCPFIIAYLRRGRWLGYAALAVSIIIVGVYQILFDNSTMDLALRLFFLAAGMMIVTLTIRALIHYSRYTIDRADRERWLVLTGWYLFTMVFIILFAPFMAIRHILLVMPITLIVFGSWPEAKTMFGQIGWSLTIALGILMAISDWQWSNVYRQQAPWFAHKYQGRGQIWFSGNWGWQWYAEAERFRPLTVGQSFQAGDFIIVATVDPAAHQLFEELPLKLVETKKISSTFFATLRTALPAPKVGYTGFNQHGIPWYITLAPLEIFRVYQFTAAAQTPQ